MRFFLSRHRITYTPVGGEAVELLAPLDMCDAEARFEGGPEVQTDALLRSAWAAHHSRGNVSMRLLFDRYVAAGCLAQAVAARHELWRWLNEHPEGELVYESAFVGQVTGPLVRWRMRAALNSVQAEDLNRESTPFDDHAGYHVAVDFNVSGPEDV